MSEGRQHDVSAGGDLVPCAELEIALRSPVSDSTQVDLRFCSPNSDAEYQPERGDVTLDLDELRGAQLSPQAYGRLLSDQVFAHPAVRARYSEVRALVQSGGLTLRVRLLVDASAAPLHALRWELLADPVSGQCLATSERTLFSRFVFSDTWDEVRIRARGRLSALAAVAAPSDPTAYSLAAVDARGELDRIRDALGGGDVTLTELGRDGPLTLSALVDGLRERTPDILYLVCHGAQRRDTGEPILYLEQAADPGARGLTGPVRGQTLVEKLAGLPRLPRLVVLASCTSAGAGETPPRSHASGTRTSAQAALGPLLARLGVPAVVAMQGRITMETVKRLMPRFFEELLKDGRVDRALAVARDATRDRHDSWMPALFLRLKGGRLWYVPGFRGADDSLKHWRDIEARVRQGKFVPIIGPDITEHIFGAPARIARRVADACDLPRTPRDRADLARVTQMASVTGTRSEMLEALSDALVDALLERHADDDPAQDDPGALMDRVARRCLRTGGDPLGVLARLPASVYVTACHDTLLSRCLAAAGREPTRLLCNWRTDPYEPELRASPTWDRPAVYHVLGALDEEDSLVVTEDDYFRYLLVTAEEKLIPALVKGRLVLSSLIFIGFPLHSWTFRALFRLIMSLGGRNKWANWAHVGVQVDPEQHAMEEVRRAREYLRQDFAGDLDKIEIYWGSAADFLGELGRRLGLAAGSDPLPPVKGKRHAL